MNDLAKQGTYVGLSARALVYAGFGDQENTITNLQRARDQNDANRIWLRVDPAYDAFRNDKRFQEILQDQGASWPQ